MLSVTLHYRGSKREYNLVKDGSEIVFGRRNISTILLYFIFIIEFILEISSTVEIPDQCIEKENLTQSIYLISRPYKMAPNFTLKVNFD